MLTPAQLHQAFDSATSKFDWLNRLVLQTQRPRSSLLAEAAILSGLEPCTPELLKSLRPDIERASLADMRHFRCLLGRDEAGQHLALASVPFDSESSLWLGRQGLVLSGYGLADPDDVLAVLDRCERDISAVSDWVALQPVPKDGRAPAEELTLSSIQSEESEAVRLVNSTLFDALRCDASDIHLEMGPTGMGLKFRIDGVLSPVGQVGNRELAEQAVARIKVLAELDIAEKRVPQDGRFQVTARGREIDLRVSVMPTIFGEDVVLRVLDRQALSFAAQGLSLDSLGFDSPTRASLRRLALEPYGMLLITGPTGSGKTTTLYSLISEINKGVEKIVTIEDPVEYNLPGVTQIPVNEKKGLTFALGLRSILRHDPDKILVGEIRDVETARIAVQSALTGHMVFTSLHANNVFDVISRFVHMGVDPHEFVSAVSGVVAQRLIRMNCPHCSEAAEPDAQTLHESGLAELQGFKFMAGQGCSHCRNTGYKGRRAIAEVLKLSDEMRELIVARASARAMRHEAARGGTRFLREIAIDYVRSGLTTLEEANRVTFVAN